MPTEIIHMTEIKYCLICGKYIGKGNNPAVCDNRACKEVFKFECFNKRASDLARKEGE